MQKLKQKLNKTIRNILKFLIPLCCGVLIFWAVYRQLDMKRVLRILTEIKYEWVILSMIAGVMSHIVRALRWRLQLQALGNNVSLRTATNAIFGTYAMNLVFPRLGEVWRCGYVAQREGMSFTMLLGSVVSDRLMDTVAVILLIAAVFFLQMNVLFDFLKEYPSIEETAIALATSPYLYLSLAVVAGAFIWLFRQKKEYRWVVRAKELMRKLWYGIRTIFTMKKKTQFILYTILIWFCYYLQLYLCMFAFAETAQLGALTALSLFVMGSIGAGVPVQGGFGPWHVAVIATLYIYGVTDPDVAGSFALVAHGAQIVVIVLLGIYTFFSILFEKKKNRK